MQFAGPTEQKSNESTPEGSEDICMTCENASEIMLFSLFPLIGWKWYIFTLLE